MSSEKKVLLAGGSGFIGQELGLELVRRGYKVVVLTRNPEQVKNTFSFPCEIAEFSLENLAGLQVVCTGAFAIINLAGQPIDTGNWNLHGKKSVYESRLKVARLLGSLIELLPKKPEVWIQASATGIYPADGAVWSDNKPVPDDGSYLAKVCHDLEKEVAQAAGAGVRCCFLRFGVVLGHGGAFAQLASLYGSGVGAPFINSDKFAFPWVHINDAVGAAVFALETSVLQGPVNVVADESTTLNDLHAAMCNHFGLQLVPPVPAAVIRIADRRKHALLFANPMVRAEKLRGQAFKFQYNLIGQALKDLNAPVHGHSRLVKSQFVGAEPADVWHFFSQPENLQRITPPWLKFRIKSISTKHMQQGTEITYRLRLKGIPMTWKSLISKWAEGDSFVDEQITGPYRTWHHTHSFEKLSHGVLIRDDVAYQLPLGKLGAMAAGWLVRKDIEQIFSHRSKIVGHYFSDAGVMERHKGEKNELSGVGIPVHG